MRKVFLEGWPVGRFPIIKSFCHLLSWTVIDAICDGLKRGKLLNIPTTCVHCFVTFHWKSFDCLHHNSARNFLPAFSDPWKVFPVRCKQSMDGWFILSPCDQHCATPFICLKLRRALTHRKEFSNTNTNTQILCIVYTFNTHFPPYDFVNVLAVIFHPPRTRGKFSSRLSVLVEFSFLHPFLLGVCSHFSAFRVDSCKEKLFPKNFFSQIIFSALSVLWKLKKKKKNFC